MFRKTRTWLAAGVLCLISASPALAQDEEKYYDARLEGHTDNVTLPGGGTALTWLVAAGLGVLCVGVMFKAGKRTHLD